MHLLHSLLISASCHTLVIAGLSLAASIVPSPAPRPKLTEVELFKLPPPAVRPVSPHEGEGGLQRNAALSPVPGAGAVAAPEEKPTAKFAAPAAVPARSPRPLVDPPKPAPKYPSGPTVTAHVRRLDTQAGSEVAVIHRSEESADSEEIRRWATVPAAERPVLPKPRTLGSFEPGLLNDGQDSDEASLGDGPSIAGGHGTVDVGRPGGNTHPLVEIIQARINTVTPLVHATAEGCRTVEGVVRVVFLVRPDGYSNGKRILSSSGSRCLDSQVETVLHLAEPYPYVAGWIPVTVRFTL